MSEKDEYGGIISSGETDEYGGVIHPESQDKEYSAFETASQFASGFNELPAYALGVAPDAINAAAATANELFGLGDYNISDNKLVAGTDEFVDFINSIGGKHDQTLATDAGRLASMAMGVQGGLSNLARNPRALFKSPTVAQSVIQKMASPVVSRPGMVLAGEAAGSIGSVAGGEVASQSLGEDYRVIGDIVGGMLADPVGSLAYGWGKQSLPKPTFNMTKLRAGKNPLGVDAPNTWKMGKDAYYGAKGLFDPKTRVAKQLARTSESPADALKSIDVNDARVMSEAVQTPASKTLDKHLMALEQAVIEENPALMRQIEGQATDNQAKISRALTDLYDGVGVEEAQKQLKASADAQVMLLDAHVQKSKSRLEAALTKLAPNTKIDTVNKLAASIINDAASVGEKHQKQLWKGLKSKAPVSSDGLNAIKRSYQKEVAEYLTKSDVPQSIREELGYLGKKGALIGGDDSRLNTFDGIKRLRTKIQEQITKDRADGNFDRARVLNKVQEEILEVMGKTVDSDELTSAITFSREFNKRFNQGRVGKIRGFSPEGGGRVDPEMTLESTIGSAKQKGEAFARQFNDIVDVEGVKLTSDSPSEIVEEYLRNKMNIVGQNGRINKSAAAGFLKQNDALMDRYPDVRKQINSAIDADNNYSKMVEDLSDLKKSGDFKFQGSLVDLPSGGVAKELLNHGDGVTSVAKAMRQLDAKGQRSLKGDFIRLLRDQSEGTLHRSGDSDLVEGKMRKFYKKHKSAFSIVLSKQEKRRLDLIMNTMGESEFPKKDIPKTKAVMNDIMGKILEYPARIWGANRGASAGKGGASIQTASFGAEGAKGVLKTLRPDRANQLMADMVLDEDLYVDMLKYADKIAQAQKKKIKPPKLPEFSYLHGWMIANAVNGQESE